MHNKDIKILLIEDNPGDARYFSEILKDITEYKITIENVDSLSKAKTALESNKYDLVITDLGLPDSNGLDTFNRINNIWDDGPIIVMTGNNDVELGRTIVRMGAQDFLTKGTSNAELIKKTIEYSLHRFNSQKIIQRKERHFSEIIEKNADGMIVTNKEGIILYVNPVAESILQNTNSNLIGTEIDFELDEEVISEEEIIDSKGIHKVIQLKVVAANWDGEFARIATLRDITELKRNQEKVKSLNTLLKTIQQINHLIVNEKNHELLLERACQLLVDGRSYNWAWIGNYKNDNEIDKIYSCGLDDKHEKLKDYLKKGNNLFCKQEIEKNNSLVKVAAKHLNCGDCPLASSYTKTGGISIEIEHQGKRLGILNVSRRLQNISDEVEQSLLDEVAHDIGLALHTLEIEKKEIESQKEIKWLTQAISDAANAVVLTNREGIIEWTNPAFTKLTGFSNEEAVGNSPNILNSGKHDKRFFGELWNTINKGETWNGEITNKRKDGEIYIEEMTIAPVKDEQGNVARFIAIKSDISERKRYEEQLIQAKNESEKSNRLKSEFLAQMSHEIRTPLNSMLSTLDFVKDEFNDLLSVDAREMVNIIDDSGKRIIRTIESILNMSELQTGSYQPLLQEVNLIKDVLEPVLDSYLEKFHTKKLKLIYEPPKYDVKVEADIYSITKVIDHILDNAYKYTNKGAVTIELKEEHDGLILSFKDTGIGISEEYLKNIFNPFSQEYQGYCRAYDGCGLGLAISKKYCELNNAGIEINSKRDEGTTVKVFFKKKI